MNPVHWSLQATPTRVALLALILTAATWTILRHVRRAGDRRTCHLELLRALILLMLAITFLQPEIIRRVEAPKRMRVAVVCDRSGSMDTVDVADGKGGMIRRADWVRHAVTSDLFSALTNVYDLDIREVCVPPAMPDVVAGTDLHAALESALVSAESLRAVLLISDGDWNLGPPPTLAAGRYRALGIPIFTITVGGPRPLPDLALESVSAPAYGLAEERLDLPVELRNRFDREVRTEVRLLRNGQIIDRAPVQLAPQSRGRVRLSARPNVPGDTIWTIEVPPEPEETDHTNNFRNVRIPIRREILRVLLADTLPRWEYRYFRNALIRDPGTEVKCWLAHPHLPPGGGRDYLTRLPSSRTEFSGYDVVVLGDIGIGPGELTESQAEEIRGLVEHQGGGLILIAGRQGRQISLARTALKDLLPIDFDPAFPKGQASPIEGRYELISNHHEHPLVQLADSTSANELLWRSLPGFFWHASVRSRPGSDVLAVHAMARNDQGRIPLIVVRSVGLGRILFMGTDAVWRWRRGVEDTYHYRFWGQVIRWMAHRRHLAHAEGLRWFVIPERPQPSVQTRLQAIITSAEQHPTGAVEAEIVSPDGHHTRITLVPAEPAWGLYEGVWTPARPGLHRVAIRDTRTNRSVEGVIEVADVVVERVGEAARPDVLREIAAVSGGRAASTENAADVIADIRTLPQKQPIEERIRLWCHPAWGAAIAIAMTVYWCARKLAGKV